MLLLAEAISRLVPESRVVEAVVRHTPIRSSYESRQMGMDPPSLRDHIGSMHLAADVGDEGLVYLVDNVVTSGNTLKAMEHHLREPNDRLRWLVYADASGADLVDRNRPAPWRYAISGSRTCFEVDTIKDVLLTIPKGSTIVHGAAQGADTIAGELAMDMGFEVEEWPAKWKQLGRKAGPIRNKEMIETCDKLIAFWNGRSTGTAHAISVAKKAGIEYEVIPCG